MPLIVQESHTCDVCRLVDGDMTPKNCSYCGLCDSWICPEDQNRWDRRARAFLRRRLEPAYKGLPDYEKHIEGFLENA